MRSAEHAGTHLSRAWLAGPLLAVALVAIKSLGAPLGEPVADDFDFLAARLQGDTSFLSGGGSLSFWRPLPHQLYYSLLGPLMLSHQWVTPLLHSLCLLAAGYLLLTGFRPHLGLVAASAVSTFVLLSEPLRSMISWPSHAVELGSILFMAATLWALGTARFGLLPLVGLLGLLCKETTLLLLPLALCWPDPGWTWRSRFTIGALVGLCVLLWGLTYFLVAKGHGIHPPASIATSIADYAPTLPQRIAWASARSTSVGLGLWHLSSWRGAAVSAAYFVLGIHLVVRWFRLRLVKRPAPARARLWWAAMLTTILILGLSITYPVWAPYRAVHISVGLALFLVLMIETSQPVTLSALVAIKALTLVLAPAPISTVGLLPPTSRSFLDFERLTRLQLLCRDTREQLASQIPLLPPHSLVVQRNFPLSATYALGGNHALQVWRGDTTLVWIGFETLKRNPTLSVSAVVDFESETRPSVSIVPPHAVVLQLQGDSLLAAGDPHRALQTFDQALVSLGNTRAPSFVASCRYRRAVVLAREGQIVTAMSEARGAVRGTSVGVDARFLLAILLADTGDLIGARLQLDSILIAVPDEPRALSLREQLSKVRPVQ